MARTKNFALVVIGLCAVLKQCPAGWILGKQLLRSGTSIGANYREAQRARTKTEFRSKIHICQQEIEETIYWIELIHEADIGPAAMCQETLAEIQQLRAIFISIGRKAIDD